MAKKEFKQVHMSPNTRFMRRPENAEEFKRITNGCGPSGWKIDIVPDTIYGLSIRDECNGHDVDWHFAESWAGAIIGNNYFSKAVHYKINQHAWLLRWPRRIRFNWYMNSVSGSYAEYHFKNLKDKGSIWNTL